MQKIMTRTLVCDALQIEHPIALGGMGSIYAPSSRARETEVEI
jgi:hypothetical protein